MIRVPKYREPTHPGEILLEEFLIPMGMSQQCLARSIRVPYLCINEIVNKRRGVAPATALRLGRYFGNTVVFWTNLQFRWDVYRAQSSEVEPLQKIQPQQVARHHSGPLCGVIRMVLENTLKLKLFPKRKGDG